METDDKENDGSRLANINVVLSSTGGMIPTQEKNQDAQKNEDRVSISPDLENDPSQQAQQRRQQQQQQEQRSSLENQTSSGQPVDAANASDQVSSDKMENASKNKLLDSTTPESTQEPSNSRNHASNGITTKKPESLPPEPPSLASSSELELEAAEPKVRVSPTLVPTLLELYTRRKKFRTSHDYVQELRSVLANSKDPNVEDPIGWIPDKLQEYGEVLLSACLTPGVDSDIRSRALVAGVDLICRQALPWNEKHGGLARSRSSSQAGSTQQTGMFSMTQAGLGTGVESMHVGNGNMSVNRISKIANMMDGEISNQALVRVAVKAFLANLEVISTRAFFLMDRSSSGILLASDEDIVNVYDGRNQAVGIPLKAPTVKTSPKKKRKVDSGYESAACGGKSGSERDEDEAEPDEEYERHRCIQGSELTLKVLVHILLERVTSSDWIAKGKAISFCSSVQEIVRACPGITNTLENAFELVGIFLKKLSLIDIFEVPAFVYQIFVLSKTISVVSSMKSSENLIFKRKVLCGIVDFFAAMDASVESTQTPVQTLSMTALRNGAQPKGVNPTFAGSSSSPAGIRRNLDMDDGLDMILTADQEMLRSNRKYAKSPDVVQQIQAASLLHIEFVLRQDAQLADDMIRIAKKSTESLSTQGSSFLSPFGVALLLSTGGNISRVNGSLSVIAAGSRGSGLLESIPQGLDLIIKKLFESKVDLVSQSRITFIQKVRYDFRRLAIQTSLSQKPPSHEERGRRLGKRPLRANDMQAVLKAESLNDATYIELHDVYESLNKVAGYAARNWDQVIQPVLAIAFLSLDRINVMQKDSKRNADFFRHGNIGRLVESVVITQDILSLCFSILSKIFECRPSFRDEICDQTILRIVEHKNDRESLRKLPLASKGHATQSTLSGAIPNAAHVSTVQRFNVRFLQHVFALHGRTLYRDYVERLKNFLDLVVCERPHNMRDLVQSMAPLVEHELRYSRSLDLSSYVMVLFRKLLFQKEPVVQCYAATTLFDLALWLEKLLYDLETRPLPAPPPSGPPVSLPLASALPKNRPFSDMDDEFKAACNSLLQDIQELIRKFMSKEGLVRKSFYDHVLQILEFSGTENWIRQSPSLALCQEILLERLEPLVAMASVPMLKLEKCLDLFSSKICEPLGSLFLVSSHLDRVLSSFNSELGTAKPKVNFQAFVLRLAHSHSNLRMFELDKQLGTMNERNEARVLVEVVEYALLAFCDVPQTVLQQERFGLKNLVDFHAILVERLASHDSDFENHRGGGSGFASHAKKDKEDNQDCGGDDEFQKRARKRPVKRASSTNPSPELLSSLEAMYHGDPFKRMAKHIDFMSVVRLLSNLVSGHNTTTRPKPNIAEAAAAQSEDSVHTFFLTLAKAKLDLLSRSPFAFVNEAMPMVQLKYATWKHHEYLQVLHSWDMSSLFQVFMNEYKGFYGKNTEQYKAGHINCILALECVEKLFLLLLEIMPIQANARNRIPSNENRLSILSKICVAFLPPTTSRSHIETKRIVHCLEKMEQTLSSLITSKHWRLAEVFLRLLQLIGSFYRDCLTEDEPVLKYETERSQWLINLMAITPPEDMAVARQFCRNILYLMGNVKDVAVAENVAEAIHFTLGDNESSESAAGGALNQGAENSVLANASIMSRETCHVMQHEIFALCESSFVECSWTLENARGIRNHLDEVIPVDDDAGGEDEDNQVLQWMTDIERGETTASAKIQEKIRNRGQLRVRRQQLAILSDVETLALSRLETIAAVMTLSLRCIITKGKTTEALYKVCIQFYKLLWKISKAEDLRMRKSRDVANVDFGRLVEATVSKMTPALYRFVEYATSDTIVSSRVCNVTKESRLVPELVYIIEQFERVLLKIAKHGALSSLKAYLVGMKRSTVRDFRIDAKRLSKVLEKVQSDNEDDGQEQGDEGEGIDQEDGNGDP